VLRNCDLAVKNLGIRYTLNNHNKVGQLLLRLQFFQNVAGSVIYRKRWLTDLRLEWGRDCTAASFLSMTSVSPDVSLWNRNLPDPAHQASIPGVRALIAGAGQSDVLKTTNTLLCT
jgi:hypothetical protein